MARVTATVQVRGFKELDAALARLPDEVAGHIMFSALTEAGEVIRRAAADNIDSRSGRTAADIRVEVQQPAPTEGVAAVGGTVDKRTGRAYILRWLEFGATGKRHGGQGWPIKGGSTDRKLVNRASRALRRIGEAGASRALRRGVRTGEISVRRALKLPDGAFRSAVRHPGFPPEAPLTRALAEHGDRALKVFKDTVWAGIVAFARGLKRAA